MITEQGTFLVNGRELVNNKPETIRNALQKISGGDAIKLVEALHRRQESLGKDS